MSNPPTPPGRKTPRRTTPRRSPLQERSSSQKNEAAGRLHRDSRPDLSDTAIFTTTPFPTKPQHVLLPSTIRKQRSRQNVENELPNLFFNRSQPEVSVSASGSRTREDERRVRRAPHLQLKKSVTALRDMYEAQEERSRPSTAVRSRTTSAASSPAIRPTTSRLRSFSSSEGLSSKGAWEMLGLPKVSADDLATLPTLSEDYAPKLDSESSFASRVRNQAGTSSPNFRTFDASSPNLPAYADVRSSSDPIDAPSSDNNESEDLSSPNIIQYDQSTILTSDPTSLSFGPGPAESSPNFIQHQYSSDGMTSDPAVLDSGDLDAESSPNFVKLATSSPRRTTSPTPSQVSTASRKRKRSQIGNSAYAGATPLFFDPRQRRAQTSSPPIEHVPLSSEHSLQSSEARALPSSPPEIESVDSQSSPVIRVHGGRFSTDRSSIQSAHTNLQSILSSSPQPLPQRPIVRAPKVDQFETLAAQKRHTSGQSHNVIQEPAKLSPVPSTADLDSSQPLDTNIAVYPSRRNSSRISVFTEELDDNFDTESIAPVSAYLRHQDLNNSQVNIISDDDRHEAADELGALPRQHSSFAAAMGQARSASFLGSSSSSSASRLNSMRNSMEERFQSMRSYTHRRSDSLRSFSRPGSSGSYIDPAAVPTWARQYYSGFYRNTFQYLYQSSSNLAYPVINVPMRTSSQRPSTQRSIPQSSSYETISSRSDLRRSWSKSVRNSIKSFVSPVIQPMIRPRLNVRQSHLTAGVGPLVSHPTRPKSEMILTRPQSAYQRQTIRRVSMPLSAADPRYHWNGIIEEPETAEEAQKLEDYEYTGTPRYSTTSSRPTRRFNASINRFTPPTYFRRMSTPHLHHDRRLHSGSSASHGFGAPYNAKPRWQPTSELTDTLGPPAWFKFDIRDLQVVCFMSGFVLVVPWFVGAVTALPHRPGNYEDLEKQAARVRQEMFETPQEGFNDGDIVARLRLEKHIRGLEEVKWQNARWWRRMNRWMSCVGLVILIVVIVLSVLGTRSHWT